MSIVLLCGSKKPAPSMPHQRSACRELLKVVEQGVLEAGGEVTVQDIREMQLPWFDGRAINEYGSSDLLDLGERIRRADSIVISAPAYWRGIGGALKNVLDLLGGAAYDSSIRVTPFTRKLVGLVVVGAAPGDSEHALAQISAIVEAMGAYSTAPHVAVDNPREAETIETVVEHAFMLGYVLAKAA